MRSGIAIVTCLAIVLSPSIAVADQAPDEMETADECAVASENAQLHRLKGRLVDAREQLLACSRPLCPAVVRKDCDRWLAEIEDAVPSIVIVASAAGSDVADVRVVVDGRTIAESLDGKAIFVDPGAHELELVRAGETVKRSVVVREGEKRRRIEIAFGNHAIIEALSEPPNNPPQEAPREEEGGRRTQTIVGWSLVTLGAIGIGLGTYFAFKQANSYSEAEFLCSPSCDPSTKDKIDEQRLASGIGFVTGGLALGAGVFLLLWRGDTKPARAALPFAITF